MEFGEMKRNTSNWSNFCMLLRRAGLTASVGLSCSVIWTTKQLHLSAIVQAQCFSLFGHIARMQTKQMPRRS